MFWNQAGAKAAKIICVLCPIQDVEVAPGNPNQFWSASEDGTIREYDKRCRCKTLILC